ncbi:Anaphase-promoting complex subunit 2 [Saguinus oedipus]|uniref:Anaphase-promoting complex subunit 2 n=1 Tax=Saguinus oedipus TaxID=9490 RepID=A0ABQ9WJ80_SAGOE|nr:Anaphase-promoting complex subunit 2 [Saguinus oedipus]
MAATVAAAVQGGSDPRPGQELLLAWNTVSTGLVPPAALGLVRPGKRAAAPRGVPGTLRALGRPPSSSNGSLRHLPLSCPATFFHRSISFGSAGSPSLVSAQHPCTADKGQRIPPKEEELRAAVEVLRGHGLHSVLEEWFVEVLQNDLQANISPEFWNAISQRENSADELQCLLLLLDAFGLLESRLDPYLRSLELLEKWTRLGLLMGTGAQGLREKVHTMLRGVLFFSTPRTFQEMIQRLYGRFLRVYMQSKRKGEGGTDPELEGELDSRYARRRYYRLLQSPLCAGCGSDKQQCWCRQALEHFHQLSQVL